MKFSIHLSTRIDDKRLELPLINYMTELALEADSIGFGGVSLTEHHLHENQGYQNSLLFGCSLAPQLKQATLVLATVNPALHHPVRLVESCNLLDQLNRGRLVVAFGSGFKETDLIAFGRDLEKRHQLFEDGMRTVMDIWKYDGKGGPLEFQVGGDKGKIESAVNPSSYRKPHPILGRGTLNDAGILDSAAKGWAILTAGKTPEEATKQFALYNKALDAAGHSEEKKALSRAWSGVGKAVHIADTDEQAVKEALAYFKKNPTGAIARRPEDMLCGSPETVTRLMRAYAAAGVGNMVTAFLIDPEDQAPLRRSFKLFKEEVMPHVKGVSAVVA
jgi:alkanesulfonate monooxygenase SsuD/methylene tetrahydromethanopterin reductase-like flavin-dependent oxidoreductase (luciferase family)